MPCQRMTATEEHPTKRWYVLRDLKRRNARRIALHDLADAGLEVFTPMMQVIESAASGRRRVDVPVIQDLLFAHEDKQILDAHIKRIPGLQYRYMRGQTIDNPMTVRDGDMERFIIAATATGTPEYFRPGEITSEMLGRDIRIVGGPLDGVEGRLLTVRGSRRRRIVVEIRGLISVAAEVSPEFIQML